MTPTRWLWLVAAAGLAIFALSFLQGWIIHQRELRGEGYRLVQIFLSAWRGVAIPVTAAAAVVALAVAIWASARAAFSPKAPAAILVLGSALIIGLIGASAWPVMQTGHASTVRLGPWFLLPVALALGLVMLVGSVAAERPSLRVVAAAVVLAAVALAGGAAGRWLGLQLAEGTGRHWEVGSYTRAATDGLPAETMTLTDETYRIGDRWSGTFESSGWTVSLDDDPACPTARGTYHAHGVGAEDLRFVMVVDPCMDGARAVDLETGTWERDP
ncbi:MAG: hypothetical protein QOI85_1361 [Chloroflexota bacterium]|nr:hypothetical protein [Chloroflexota bacterium]